MPPLLSHSDPHESADDQPAESTVTARPSQRPALVVLGVIGVLLIGFALGVFARIPLDGSSEPTPNAVDIGFSQDMSVHHAQAVEMAGVALAGSDDPAIKSLAYDILTSQQNQLGRMHAWLQLWGEPLLPTGGYMGWMADAGSSHGHGGESAAPEHTGPVSTMPGMASQQDLVALRQATGTAQDILFLQLMLRHHLGGVPMTEYALERAETSGVRDLAEKMARTQAGEVTLMTRMLDARGASPLPYP
ncbi:DUF305 domain-containing protein [Nocardia otitidiscaviarum]|uniref:DUF305 domain-containing protein n=1 Tax=Nocardia otitidiscaviarum TaxID=1823 RepID=UPI00189581CE|nr:DUF305 domain-containing protein [Nocardia otitidiscaviarum]